MSDIWAMSDAEFDVNSMSDFGSTQQDELEQQVPQDAEEQIHEEDEHQVQGDYEEQVEPEQLQHSHNVYDDGSAPDSNEDANLSVDTDTGLNYEAEFKKIVGSPIKANGKEITVDSAEDAIKLMQMGANYHKQMQQLKPAKRIIAMLEAAELMDEQKLNHVIDIMRGDSKAIQKLIQDKNVDTGDLYSDEEVAYTPNQHQVSDERIELDTLFNELNATQHGQRLLQEVVGTWDQQSRHTLGQTPQLLRVLSDQVESGIYDVIVAEVDKQRMLGNIPDSAPMLQAYEQVGKYLQAQGRLSPTGSKQGNVPQQRTTVVQQPKATVNPASSNTRKRATNTARSKSSSVSQQMDNVFAMSDEEFKRKYM